jgi:hypothetical protein
MSHAPSRRVPYAHVLLTLLVVVSATACGVVGQAAPPPPAPPVSAAPTDPEVGATGLPSGTKVEVTDSSPGDEAGVDLDFVSPIYTVTPIGPLDQPATFSLQLDNALPTSTPILVATRPDEGSPWTWHGGRLTDDHQHVRFRATTLAQVGVLALDRSRALTTLRSDVRRNLFPHLPAHAPKVVKPTCQQTAAARQTGYATAATSHKTLLWCFGLRNQKRVVTVTNRRSVPVEVVHTGMKVLAAPPTPSTYAGWPGVLGTTHTLLPPGGTATYDAELAPKAKVKLVAASTAPAQALRLLQASSEAFATRLDALGAGPVRPAPAFAAFLDEPLCVAAVKAGVPAVVRQCFAPRQLRAVFGTRSVLIEPLLAGRYSAAFFDRLGTRLATDAASQRDVVRVHRTVPDFSGLVGLWSGPARVLSLDAKGVVTETLQDSGKLVIQLTYQLADPVIKDGATTASATLTTVKVGNRKLLNGRIPQAGDTGTWTLRTGTVTPPFLRTNYCDAAATKKHMCGG